MHLHTKFQDFPSLGSNTRALTDGQMDRQTDGQTDGTKTITLPAKAGGNNHTCTSDYGTDPHTHPLTDCQKDNFQDIA